jgi:hypothetical protein
MTSNLFYESNFVYVLYVKHNKADKIAITTEAKKP